jgi:outer membrane lipoprotein-sorting protein
MMRYGFRFVPAVLLLAVSAAGPLAAQDTGRLLSDRERDTLFASFETRLAATQTMMVPFVQERDTPLSDEPLVSKGICRYKAPAFLRWEYTEPYRTLLVYRDGKAAKFDVIDGRLRKMPRQQDGLALVMGEILYWMKGDFKRSKDFYKIEVRETEREYRVTLIPRAKALSDFISSIMLTFSRETFFVTAVTMNGSGGDQVAIRFEGQVNNTALDDTLFSLSAPALP